jgi:enoyl-CoA hydratase/2-(1,2-epoxy-1,2-dihydrophenyl)acetyl-CoA isomerase
LLETRFGLLPDMGATVWLPRIVGESRARELILLGEIIDATEALRIGLANRVVTDGDLDAATAELADRLVAQPPIAVRGARRAIEASWYSGPAESLKLAVEEQIRCLESEDFKEARQAMVEGRSPQWRGR